jgi:signal transduction histidine kinase
MPERGRGRLSVANAFALAFLVCGAVVIAAYGWFVAQRERARLEASVVDDLVAMGVALEPAVADVRDRDGDRRAQKIIARANRENHEVRVRWTWLDVPPEADDAPRVRRDRSASSATSLNEGTWMHALQDGDSRRVFVVVRLTSASGARPAALELSRPVLREAAIVRDAILSEVAAAAVIALLTAVVARFLGQWLIGGPLDRVIAQARAVGAGNLDNRLKLRGTIEIFELKTELNAMCDQLRAARERVDAETRARVEALEQLRHADRLRTVGTLASGIAHELGTPLNVIMLRAKMVTREGGKAAESAEVIAGQAARMTRIVRQLLDFARRKTPKRMRCDLADVAEHTTSLLSTLAERSNITLRLERASAPLVAEVDAGQLEQALTNLVVNAVQASAPGSEVVVAADLREVLGPGGESRVVACLEVRDHGSGIAPENLDRIFEPFFTTKDVGQGTGLGLAVAHGIVNDHGGFIRAASERGNGTTFAICVPMEATT